MTDYLQKLLEQIKQKDKDAQDRYEAGCVDENEPEYLAKEE